MVDSLKRMGRMPLGQSSDAASATVQPISLLQFFVVMAQMIVVTVIFIKIFDYVTKRSHNKKSK